MGSASSSPPGRCRARPCPTRVARPTRKSYWLIRPPAGTSRPAGAWTKRMAGLRAALEVQVLPALLVGEVTGHPLAGYLDELVDRKQV